MAFLYYSGGSGSVGEPGEGKSGIPQSEECARRESGPQRATKENMAADDGVHVRLVITYTPSACMPTNSA